MITVTQQPDGIQLSENPIPIEVVLTTNTGRLVVEPGGVRARIISQPNGGLPVNTFLGLDWTTPDGASFSVGFHTDGPFPSAYEIPEYVSGDVGTYWNQVADIIGGNADVAPYFIVYAEQNLDGSFSLWAVARENDPEWTVNWSGDDGNGPYTAEPGSYPETFEEYRVRVDVLVNTDDGYRRVGTAGSPPNANSRASFDISRILSDALKADLPYPAVPSWGTSTPQTPDRINDYYLRVSEFSESGGFQDVKYVRNKQVLLGGVANFVNAAGNYITSFTESGIWLNTRPDRRRVGPNEPVYLASIRRAFTTGFEGGAYLEIEETDDQGNVTTRLLHDGNRVPVDGYAPILWPVGPAELAIGANAIFYRVRVKQNRTSFADPLALTPWRTFILDRTEYESVRYLAYLNSFFLPEVLRCVGDVAKSASVSSSTARMVRQVGSDISVPDVATYRAQVRDSYVFATGYKERLEIETVLHELYRSPRLYEITTTGFTPLLARARSFPLGTTGQNLHSATIECDLALDDQSYSRIDDRLIIPEPDFWQSPDGGYWTSPDETPWNN